MSEAMTKSENKGAMMVSEVMNTGVGYTDMNLADRTAAVAFYNATSNPANKLKDHHLLFAQWMGLIQVAPTGVWDVPALYLDLLLARP